VLPEEIFLMRVRIDRPGRSHPGTLVCCDLNPDPVRHSACDLAL
jgi:hypothetical protein